MQSRGPSSPTRSRTPKVSRSGSPRKSLSPSKRLSSYRGPLTPGRRRSTRPSSVALLHQLSGLAISADPSSTIDNVVIVELGSLYTKAGFAGDSEPQYVIDVDHFLNDIEWNFAFEVKSQRQLDQLEIGLEYLFQAMIETLLVDIKSQRVIVLSPTLLPTPIKRVICKVLCSTFLASSVIFHPQSVCTVIGAGIRAGLVVDIGYTQTVVTPVYDLRELVPRTRFSVRCGKHNLENVENGMPLDVSLNQCYFESHDDDDDDELSLPDLILQTIKNLETDVRGEMMNNVIFTGECIVPDLRAIILNQLGVMYRAVETLGSWSGSSLYFAAVGWCLPQDRKLLGEISRDQVQRGNYSLDIN